MMIADRSSRDASHRVEGFTLERALEFARAAKLSNEDGDRIEALAVSEYGYSQARFFDSGYGPEVYVASRAEEVHVVFRGTDRVKPDHDDRNLPKIAQDWRNNLSYQPVAGPYGGHVHKGLFEVLVREGTFQTEFWSSIYETIVDFGNDGKASLWFTGCSQGGMMATFAAALFALSRRKVDGVYTFGSPCPGDLHFAQGVEASVGEFYRVVNHNDLFATMPPDSLGFGQERIRYHPVGELKYLSPDGSVTDSFPSASRFKRRIAELKHAIAGTVFSGDSDATLSRIKRSISAGLQDHFVESYVAALERLISGTDDTPDG